MKMSNAHRVVDLARRYDSAMLEARVNRPIFGLWWGTPSYTRPTGLVLMEAILQVRYLKPMTRMLNRPGILKSLLDAEQPRGITPSYYTTPPASMAGGLHTAGLQTRP